MIKKTRPSKAILLILIAVLLAGFISYIAVVEVRKSNFEKMIETYYTLLANGSYDEAVAMMYYKPENQGVKDFYLQHLEENGTPIIGCEVVWTKHIGLGLYQSYVRVLDGNENDISYKTFFKENGEWQMASALFELPESYQNNPNLELDERIQDPDTVTIIKEPVV